ncbi:MAG TPA: 30S ribosomal protein S9 [Myxococcales bacterium]|nr:30S ribosomal protein S9 [Myxococcales bacterium]
MAKAIYATGRRKEAVARVRMVPGSGNVHVNGRPIREYLRRDSLVRQVMQPLEAAQIGEGFDLVARVQGGGASGQAGALQLGVARALLRHDAALREPLRKAGLLTRDPRMKERKKYGLRGARRAFQFSKR